jgi:hypothetical protein
VTDVRTIMPMTPIEARAGAGAGWCRWAAVGTERSAR